MAQLSGPEIKRQMGIPNPTNPDSKPNIIITPFNEDYLGSNSYDLHLNSVLKVYADSLPRGLKPFIDISDKLDDNGNIDRSKLSMRDNFTSWRYYLKYLFVRSAYDNRNPRYFIDPFVKKKPTIDFEIPRGGALLLPGIGYLGSTEEYTETYRLFPYIDGKSSTGRNFIINHHTAGRGDDGFCGNWTLEMQFVYPTLIKPLMPIGQTYYEEFIGERKPYNTNPNSHYNGQSGATVAAELKVAEFGDKAK
ncbi:MAG: hypothetical protein LBO08_03370 [Rickettsiales bacterium]|jgi:deoxycytidine triphosphate deaminase|nr:hypothetical protein [Rickettsiales bacterium]